MGDARIGNQRKSAFICVLLLIVLYALTFSVLSMHRHDVFETHGYDLGNVDQALWNTIHGRPFAFTNMDGIEMPGLESRLALHFEPILLPISLLYLLWSDPRVLLVLQAAVVALGAWPAFQLAREKLKSDFAGLAFAACYLLFPALEAATMFDFHAVTLAAPPLLFAFYYLEKRGWKRFATLSILAMACKEDMCLSVAAMGLYLLFVRRERLEGLATFFGALAWFYLAVFVISPPFSPAGSNIHWGRYAYLGEGPLEMVRTFFTRPEILAEQLGKAHAGNYILGLLLPVGFLALLSPSTLLLSLPSLAVNLLSTDAFMHRLEEFHYAAPIVPFFVISAIYGMERLSRWIGRLPGTWQVVYLLSALVFSAGLGYHICRGYSPLALPFRWPPLTAHHLLAEKFIKMIPPDAVLFAQSDLNPHVSQRSRIYQGLYHDDIEYIFLDVSSLPNEGGVHQHIKKWLAEGEFGPVAAEDGYLLLRRGAPSTPLPDEFYIFIRCQVPGTSEVPGTSCTAQYPMEVDFGPLRFLGFDALYNREEEVRFNLYWQTHREVEEDYFIALYLLNEKGEVVGGTEEEQPAAVWYPTSRWKPGEVVRVFANTLAWWTRDRSRYGIALGVLEGRDIWDVNGRLRPHVKASELAPRLLGEGTLLRLLEFGKLCGFPRAIEERRLFARPKVQNEAEAELGGKVRLIGYDLSQKALRPGQNFRLTLYWQALSPIEEDYTVFTHLLDEAGQLRGGKDNPPVKGMAPTSLWLPGEFIRDEYEIPLSEKAPAGDYTIEVGMYQPDSGERLSTPSGESRIILGRVRVSP